MAEQLAACLHSTGIAAMPCMKALMIGGPRVRKEKSTTRTKRLGVSAEAGGSNDAEDVAPKYYDKSDAVRDQILEYTQGKTLFAGLGITQLEAVVDAMFEVKCQPGQTIISQGDVRASGGRSHDARTPPARRKALGSTAIQMPLCERLQSCC